MSKESLKIIIGENIRNERTSRSISIDELAEMLNLTPGFVGLIERGQRGTTPSTLFKLSKLFKIPVDAFFYQSTDLILNEDPTKGGQKKKIESLISDFTEIELEFVVSMVKAVRAMNRSEEKTNFVENNIHLG